jgi:hypothetical protein
MAYTKPVGEKWTDSISHGELLRSGYDQTLQVGGKPTVAVPVGSGQRSGRFALWSQIP